MPQLDFHSPLLLSQVVWGAIIFVLLYFALARVGLPPIGQILASRAQAIGADLERARLAKQDADQAVQELRTARARAIAEAQAEIAEATTRARAEAAARAAALAARLNAQLAESEAAIAASRGQALATLAHVAGETAGAIVERLAGLTPDPAALRGAVHDTLAARGLPTG